MRLRLFVVGLLAPCSTPLRVPKPASQLPSPITTFSSPACPDTAIVGFNGAPPPPPAALDAATAATNPLTLQAPSTKRAPLPPREKRVGPPRKPRPTVLDATNSTALYEEGKRLLQLHRPQQAAGVLTKLSKLTPEDGRVWMKLMSAHKRARKMRKAEATLRDGIRACPDNALLRQALADLCRERKQYAEARTHFKAAMELDPTLASVYDSWGRMEAMLGQHSVAAHLYEMGLELKQTARLCHALGVLLDLSLIHI